MAKFQFPNGLQFVLLSPTSGQWRDMNDNHLRYTTVENVEYKPTLGEQFLTQRGIIQ